MCRTKIIISAILIILFSSKIALSLSRRESKGAEPEGYHLYEMVKTFLNLTLTSF